MTDELDIEMITINKVLDIIYEMIDSGEYHNPTLEELEQRLM
jgi:hypothetical protein